MKLPIALGIAFAGLTVAAAAQSASRHIVINRSFSDDVKLDANEDGWITRGEASTAYEQIFNELDANDDGKLDDSDREQHRIHVTGDAPAVHIFRHGDGDRREVRVVTGDLSAEDEARIEVQVAEAMARAEADVARAERHAERAERMSEEAERRAERVEREVERAVERAEREGRHVRGDRHIVIIRGDGDEGGAWSSLDGDEFDFDVEAPVPPIPPVPPIAPFMLLIANSEEADLNGDGALTLDEFRNMHLRFFDASDANGDGRVRFEEPPAPPRPPAPPAPPEPPRRR
ncbi:MAG: hypothetical protein JNL81_01020 [Hyphomonadaceae bacterium]|nr:hypothetical protein [Hyphomonadaceae bacterium]